MTGLNEEDLKKNVQDKETWLRFVYLLAYGIVFYFSVWVTLGIAVVQFFAKLLSATTFTRLSEFGDNLATYQAQVARYLVFSSDEKPYPFMPFPSKTEAVTVTSF